MDGLLFEWLFSLSHRNAIVDGILVFLANYAPYLLGAAFLVFLSKGGEWRRRLLLFSEAAMGLILSRGLITEFIRFFYERPRPPETLGVTSLIQESTGAFPSGHMTFLVVLGTMLVFYEKRWGAWFLGISFVVGLARIAAGVHWPTDILGGIALAALSGVVVHALVKPSLRKLGR